MISAGAGATAPNPSLPIRTLIEQLIDLGVSSATVGLVAEELAHAMGVADVGRSEPATAAKSGRSAVGRADNATAANPAADDIHRQIAKARRVLPLIRRLSKKGAAVAGTLIERYNRVTGRCDPGIARISADCGFSERSVRRALKELAGLGLFEVALRSGSGHANAYRPNWAMLGEIADGRDAAMATAAKRPTLSATPASSDPQTHVKNTTFRDGEGGTRRARPDPRQREMLYSMPSGSARQAAGQRFWDGMRESTVGWSDANRTELWGRLSAEIIEAGTVAELRKRGSGAAAALQLVEAATGPPLATGTG